jgi:hypothetical protein
MQNDRYVVIKLITGEEILSHLVHEDDYEIRVLFPMLTRLVNTMTLNGAKENIVLSPYTYFAADDEFTFQKQHLVFLKDMDPRHEIDYNTAIDEFIALSAATAPEYDPEELKKLTDKLQNMFKDRLTKDETFEDIEELPSIRIDSSKIIH